MSKDRNTSVGEPAGKPAVELRAARIPLIGALAHHHWFVVRAEGRVDRWEAWQRPDAGGESWGHLHRDLLAPEQGVGNGGSWRVTMFQGGAAIDLAARLADAPKSYPWRDIYSYWPGPNSNTFAQWVLGNRYFLSWRGFGRRYRGLAEVLAAESG